MTVLRDILTASGFCHAYIMLDALDECREQDELLSFLEEMTSWELDVLHVLATSRPDPKINECLASRIMHVIDLQSVIVDADIQLHICEELQRDFSLRKWPLEVKNEIETSLMEGAKGMWVTAILLINTYSNCHQ
jgi:hypothetical protein